MAERPVFIPQQGTQELVREEYFNIVWSPGFAPVQKKKNIIALHEAAARAGYNPLLEISSKSEEKLGQHLSAFHLKVREAGMEEIKLESAFQGSKVFEKGGPYTDLYMAEGKEAKRDPRLQESGKLIGFEFNGFSFPLEPKTIFYDWLYINAIYPHRDWLERLYKYAGFTDIEFNPSKSINCQARSCALFVSLRKNNQLQQAVASPQEFTRLIAHYDYHPQLRNGDAQDAFF
ncbi:MAG: hypothetical protein ROO76_15205 [Terriglobia bacterium]|jgi:hypothetical protein|nr:hypothetical protein [Terriglobia bacterium]